MTLKSTGELETWTTDFVADTFQKETRSDESNGRREGRNEHVELWQETWHATPDGMNEGWFKETEREEGKVNTKWGEG